jgi:hypothetical protein
MVNTTDGYCCIHANNSRSLRNIDLINKDKQSNQEQEKEMEISGPYNAKHVTHVGFDASTGEFTGLPQEWQTLLQHSGISKVEQYQNPQVNGVMWSDVEPCIDFACRLYWMPLASIKKIEIMMNPCIIKWKEPTR